MDQKKKQMIMFGVLGALVLGAGGYFVLLRDSGDGNQQAFDSGPAVKRERTAPVENKSAAKKKEAKPAAKKEETAVRRERETVEQETAQRREKSRGDRKIEKKKELKPAA